MEIKERILEIIETKELTEHELEKLTGIKKQRWEDLKKEKATEEHILAIIEIWPEFSFWITTGLTIPRIGQTEPKIDKLRRSLRIG